MGFQIEIKWSRNIDVVQQIISSSLRIDLKFYVIKYVKFSFANVKIKYQPESMRSKRGLWNTVSYLLSDVLSIETYGFVEKYDFISDRLRAVRQELTIQVFWMTHQLWIILMSTLNSSALIGLFPKWHIFDDLFLETDQSAFDIFHLKFLAPHKYLDWMSNSAELLQFLSRISTILLRFKRCRKGCRPTAF